MKFPVARELFPLDPAVTYFNHGGYGVTPRQVLAAYNAARAQVESNPNRFFANKSEYMDKWRENADRVARRFCAKPGSVALLANVTEGIDAVLRSVPLRAGDEIMLLNRGYPAVLAASTYLAERAGVKIVQAQMQFPNPSPEQCVQAVADALTPRTRLAVLDHITSGTALVLPVEKLVKLCHDNGTPVLIDGAHAPGQLALDIPKIGADWYAANLHKWYGAPRSCGFLWAASPDKDLVPPTISSGVNEAYPTRFAWTGTRDPSSWLAIPAAFGFMDGALGEEKALRTYCHDLTLAGARHLAHDWGTKITTPNEMTASMTLVPMPPDLPYALTAPEGLRLQTDLAKAGFETCVPFFDDKSHYIRVASYAYTRPSDFGRLSAAVKALR